MVRDKYEEKKKKELRSYVMEFVFLNCTGF